MAHPELTGPRYARYYFYAMNTIVLILACVVLGVGIALSNGVSSFLSSLNPSLDPTFGRGMRTLEEYLSAGLYHIQTVSSVFISAGAVTLLVTLVGYYAAYKKSRSITIAYSVVLSLIVVMELGAGIAFAVNRPVTTKSISQMYHSALNKYDYVSTTLDTGNHLVVVLDRFANNNTLVPTLLVNVVQTWLGCCGGEHGYTDFHNSPYWIKNRTPPVFCCKLKDHKTLELEQPTCLLHRNPDNSWMNTGCDEKAMEIVSQKAPSVIGVAVGVGVVNILGVAVAAYMCYKFTAGYEEL
ncbi:tetraspanin-1-like [Paramacrobiotus metropolitanus]|uniref:tetraspanin-1-like n=1 Tax=Paramacrobiotus metropolitanus TaxID=2943436 RepID=UPI0024458320|nr:tetraspanin-1-like [Paramacrobiotus metropolitanus]